MKTSDLVLEFRAGKYLDELRRTEVAVVHRAANQHELGRMEICDRFWPYLKPAAPSQQDPEQALYVTRVRGFFLEPACVSSVFSAADEKLAVEWYRGGVPLDQVQRAILSPRTITNKKLTSRCLCRPKPTRRRICAS